MMHFPDGTINLSFHYDAAPNSVIFATGSIDQTGSYVFDVQARAVQETASRTVSFLGNMDGADTVFTFWNPTGDPQDLLMTFFTENGTYKLPVHVDGHGTSMFNLSELVMKNVPDEDGPMLPMEPAGTAEIHSASGIGKKFNLVVDIGKFNVQTGTCSGDACNCGDYIVALWIDPTPWQTPVQAGTQLTGMAQR